MANESLISVPPNIDDPVVLRRFLSRLVEQLDVVIGNRANKGYASEEELAERAETILARLADAEANLAEANQTIEDALQNASSEFENEIEANKVAIEELQDVTPVKGSFVVFTTDATDIDVKRWYNVNIPDSSRIAVGHYRIRIARETIYGKYLPTNSFITASVANAGAKPYHVRVEDAGSGFINVYVYTVQQSGTTNTILAAVDPASTEEINVMLLFNVPLSNLPPAGV